MYVLSLRHMLRQRAIYLPKLTEVPLTLQLQTTASRNMVNGSKIIFMCLYYRMTFVLIKRDALTSVEMSGSKIVREYTLPN